ncbi:MAG: nucleoside triphosphate pyrophosphohydrolase [Bacteroidales bacterium]|nr:nucleoside triphosphate pyrophosphohydrolase [Bacteroidales bacterium]
MEIKHTKEVEAFDNMLSLMEKVRKECPWDNAQTNDSLRTLTIEEIYELSQAIMDRDYKNICKELGDVMMHVVFYSLIGKEESMFDLCDVFNSLSEKLIRRHPHVFCEDGSITYEDVEKNWEKIKLKEGNRSALSGVPQSLPSLVKAYRMQDKAKGVGFDWDNAAQVWEKVEEELQELRTETEKENNKEKIENEFGDVLFALINYARFIDVNPDTALEKTNRKFKSRFQYIEEKSKERGKNLSDMSLDEMNSLWEEAKSKEQ